MVKISVIVPVYNSQKYLRKCLDSILKQTLREIEIILVNDGSTDNSLNVMKEYEMIYPEKFILIDGKNHGAGGARNRGIDIARGEYICFIDSDDYILPDMLELLYNEAEKQNADIARCSNRTVFGPFSFGNINSGNYVCENGSVVIPNSENLYAFK